MKIGVNWNFWKDFKNDIFLYTGKIVIVTLTVWICNLRKETDVWRQMAMLCFSKKLCEGGIYTNVATKCKHYLFFKKEFTSLLFHSPRICKTKAVKNWDFDVPLFLYGNKIDVLTYFIGFVWSSFFFWIILLFCGIKARCDQKENFINHILMTR